MNGIYGVSKKLQYVCDVLCEIIDDDAERIWVDARIKADIEAGVDNDALARELADEFRVDLQPV